MDCTALFDIAKTQVSKLKHFREFNDREGFVEFSTTLPIKNKPYITEWHFTIDLSWDFTLNDVDEFIFETEQQLKGHYITKGDRVIFITNKVQQELTINLSTIEDDEGIGAWTFIAFEVCIVPAELWYSPEGPVYFLSQIEFSLLSGASYCDIASKNGFIGLLSLPEVNTLSRSKLEEIITKYNVGADLESDSVRALRTKLKRWILANPERNILEVKPDENKCKAALELYTVEIIARF